MVVTPSSISRARFASVMRWVLRVGRPGIVSCLCDAHGHGSKRIREVRLDAPGWAGELDRPEPRQELLEHDLDLELCQVGAEAEVRAAAPERDVGVGPPPEIEAERL